jgi:hypothetical protein
MAGVEPVGWARWGGVRPPWLRWHPSLGGGRTPRLAQLAPCPPARGPAQQPGRAGGKRICPPWPPGPPGPPVAAACPPARGSRQVAARGTPHAHPSAGPRHARPRLAAPARATPQGTQQKCTSAMHARKHLTLFKIHNRNAPSSRYTTEMHHKPLLAYEETQPKVRRMRCTALAAMQKKQGNTLFGRPINRPCRP